MIPSPGSDWRNGVAIGFLLIVLPIVIVELAAGLP